jgi:competence protein ComEA
LDGEALSREVPSARADAARRRTSGRRASGARTASAPQAARRSWLARIVRVASIALVLLGLAGIGVAASTPGAASNPRALVNAVLDASSQRHGTPAPALGSSAGNDVWLAPARATRGEPPPPAPPADASTPAPAPAAPNPAPQEPCPPPASRAPTGPPSVVVLNRADASELMRLPGIGRRRAEAIIQLRERLGGFKRPSDLLRVRGIGTRSLERLLPLVIVDEPAEPRGSVPSEK